MNAAGSLFCFGRLFRSAVLRAKVGRLLASNLQSLRIKSVGIEGWDSLVFCGSTVKVACSRFREAGAFSFRNAPAET